MKKAILWLIAAVLVTAAIIMVRNAKHDAATKSNPDNKPVVKIGAQFPLTGNMADQLLSQKEYQGYQDVYTLDERGQFHSKHKTYIVKNGELVPVTED